MLKRKGLLFIIIIVLWHIGASPHAVGTDSGKVIFSSIFTDLTKDCKNAFESVEEGGDMPLKCKGCGQYYIYIFYSVYASHITVYTGKNDDDSIYLSSERGDFVRQKDSKVEWRLADGQPFAVILKVSKYNENVLNEAKNPYQDQYKIGEFILVKGLKGYEHIDLQFNAKKTPNAFAKARESADAAYLKSRP